MRLVRVQLLAGARVNDTTPQKQTALHLCAVHDRAAIASVLLDNQVDYDALDDGLNNGASLCSPTQW
jgi:hypothetical protein